MSEPHVISSKRVWLARAIAAAADLLQIVIFPAVIEGPASPLNIVIDVAVASVMILLVGWHIAFVPSFIVEMMPFADLAPTWTIAVLFVTRGKTKNVEADQAKLPLEWASLSRHEEEEDE